MSFLGKWEVKDMLSFGDDNLPKYITKEEYQARPDYDPEEEGPTSIFDMMLVFLEGGKIESCMKVSQEPTAEDLAYIEKKGMKYVDGVLTTETFDYKEEDGKILYNSGIKGTFLGEETNPWMELTIDDEGYLHFLTVRLQKVE